MLTLPCILSAIGLKTKNILTYNRDHSDTKLFVTQTSTIMSLNIGTPKSNKFSICSRCKINYF